MKKNANFVIHTAPCQPTMKLLATSSFLSELKIDFVSIFKEIMKIAHNLENDLIQQKQRNKELEEYLDVLLLKVMETHPKILQNPYIKQR